MTMKTISYIGLIVIMVSVAFARNVVWHDEESLWLDTVLKSQNKIRPAYELGRTYALQSNTRMAFKYLQQAKSINPSGFSNIFKLHAEKFAADGRIEDAIKEYKIILDSMPNAAIFNSLGNLYYEQGRLADARNSYMAAISLQPDFSAAHCNLGVIHDQMNNFDAAIQEYKTAIALTPNDPEPHAQLGYTYAKMNLIDDAVREFSVALDLDPNHKSAKRYLEQTLNARQAR